MINSLALTQNAQFYVPRIVFTDDIVNEIIDAASTNIAAGTQFLYNKVREDRQAHDNLQYKCSLRIFKSERGVHFLEDYHEMDTIHSFILILEIGGNIAILRKSTANIADVVENYLDIIDHRSMINCFDDEGVEFQKLSLRNMTVSNNAVRSKSYEAADLKGILSVHSAGRSIPYFLRVRQGGKLRTITTTTARIVESSGRASINEIAVWAKRHIDDMATPTGDKTFLDAFAGPVGLKEVLGIATPKAILVEVPSLLQHIESDHLVVSRRKNGALTPIGQKLWEKLLLKLEQVYEVGAAPDYTIDRMPKSKIKINLKSITIRSKILQEIILSDAGREASLQTFLIKHGLYTICFSDPKYMYYKGSCFEDRSGVSEIDQILRMFETKPALAAATSEKGSFHPASTHFSNDSIFGIIESIHGADDYILCDDLGTEWADHITFNLAERSINFIHSKHGSASTSASNLHEVVGQGIKNLGNMFFNKKYFLDKKHAKLKVVYKTDRVTTRIPRLRRGISRNLGRDIDTLLQDFNTKRKCILCCTFLSKVQIETAFNRIKRRENVPGYVIQLLWILSSFAHAAKELNVVPVIYCQR